MAKICGFKHFVIYLYVINLLEYAAIPYVCINCATPSVTIYHVNGHENERKPNKL